MTVMDRVTDEIAHFIGMLQVTTEQSLMRDAYEEFLARKPQLADPDASPFGQAPFEAPHAFIGFDPDVPYRSPAPDFHYGNPWYSPPFKLSFPPFNPQSFDFPGYQWKLPESVGSSAAITFQPPALEPPGSVATYANQTVFLSDDDYFGVGGHGLVFAPDAIDNKALLAAADYAYARSPIGVLERPGSSAEIIQVIKSAGELLDGFAADPDGAFQVFVEQAETLDGIYVNGKLVEEAPKLEDYYEFDDEEEDSASQDGKTGNAVVGEDGSIVVEASVTLIAGENTLVNEAILKNFWTAAKVTAVLGDHVEVNAIVQINAIWDADRVGASLGNWESDGAVNEVLNIAGFHRQDLLANDDPADVKDGGFPQFWSVTQIDGDLMILNWIEQFIFQSDNDIGVLSSSGVTTSVISGDNLGVNQTSIFELGFSYDLIIIGGSVYDANIIQQINVLFDNDIIGAVPGFQTSGNGSVSTSGNLLWNQAHIMDIGGADRFGALPEAYLKAAKSLAAGGTGISKGVLKDDAFAGLDGLRVLYIKGDLLSLQYVKQTSILGDSDQIALAMNELKPHLDGDWSIATGKNALINNAAIYDLDSFGKTYVGGQKYSQETLIQAELISSKPDHLGGHNPDALVSEAVLFLDNSMLKSPGEATAAVYVPSAHDAPMDDGLQHMLGH